MDLDQLRRNALWIAAVKRTRVTLSQIGSADVRSFAQMIRKKIEAITPLLTLFGTIMVAISLYLQISKDRVDTEATFPELDFGVSRLSEDAFFGGIRATNPNNRKIIISGMRVVGPEGWVAVLESMTMGATGDYAFPGRRSFGPNALRLSMPGAELAPRETRYLRFLIAKKDWRGETRQGGSEITDEQARSIQIELTWRYDQEGAEAFTKTIRAHGVLRPEETED